MLTNASCFFPWWNPIFSCFNPHVVDSWFTHSPKTFARSTSFHALPLSEPLWKPLSNYKFRWCVNSEEYICKAHDNKQDFEITKENMGLKQQDILNTDRLRLKNMNASILTMSNSWCPATNTSVFGFDSNAKFAKLSNYYTLVARHHWIDIAPITDPSSIILIIIGS